ncbi:hypothetical protein [Mycobacterium sp. AZCC_0083]|nr:hypothetical protein [Mycobacterium sp. AZCC_0083]MBB5162350.1 hypothetical protein [Mycobacterium sp. AZCC_0083]
MATSSTTSAPPGTHQESALGEEYEHDPVPLSARRSLFSRFGSASR